MQEIGLPKAAIVFNRLKNAASDQSESGIPENRVKSKVTVQNTSHTALKNAQSCRVYLKSAF